MHAELATSQALMARLADLKVRMQAARVTQAEIKAFQKVAAIMDDGRGRLDGDYLIAASFLVEPDGGTFPQQEM